MRTFRVLSVCVSSSSEQTAMIHTIVQGLRGSPCYQLMCVAEHRNGTTVRVRSFFGYGSCVATATVLGIMPRVVTRDMHRSSLLRRSCPPLMSEAI